MKKISIITYHWGDSVAMISFLRVHLNVRITDRFSISFLIITLLGVLHVTLYKDYYSTGIKDGRCRYCQMA